MADEFDPLVITLAVTETLDVLRVPYFIGGSLASILYGMIRTTNDADLIARLHREQVDPLVTALSSSFYLDRDAVMDAIARRSVFNLIHLETMFKVDVYVAKGRPFDQSRFQRRTKQALLHNPDRTAYIGSAEDTMLAKLEWYQLGEQVSERQWRDVLGIIKARGDKLDLEYLREWASNLGIADLLEQALVAARQ